MVCIVPHFIIFLCNNHIYIRIQAWFVFCACLKLNLADLADLNFS
jgi:hypothetical protein